MSSLKVIKNRIRSVNNTKKITQTMKLVSAAKYTRAEKELQSIRPFGNSSRHFFNSTKITPTPEAQTHLILVLSGDRGLCGGIHSGLVKAMGVELEKNPANIRQATKLICIGEKNRIILSRVHSEKILWIASEIGKKPPTFFDAGLIAEKVAETMKKHVFTRSRIFFNKLVNKYDK